LHASDRRGHRALEGDVALSFGNAPFLSTDDDDERLSETGFKASGWIGATFGDWRVFGDVNVYGRDIGDEDFADYAPGGARSIGLHGGRNFGPAYAGAFIGKNQFQSDDPGGPNDYLTGELYGFEGQYDMGNVSFFAQYGRADMVGDPTDVAFTGNFARVGVSANIEELTLTADFEKGNSPDIFEDEPGEGKYRALGVVLDYQITDRIIGTVSYETMEIIANTEDSGFDDYYSIGIRIPLGAGSGKRNNLSTSYRPGLAAAWASALD
jgi:Gram-negative porin